jgi:hypothetical protein
LVDDFSLRICPGDLLLVEASPDWTRRLEYVVGRLCGVRLATASEPTYVPARISQDVLGLIVNVIGGFRRAEEMQPRPASPGPEDAPGSGKVRARRKVKTADEERRRAEKRHKLSAQPDPVIRIAGDDVVGVCVCLVRLSPGSILESAGR